MTIEPEVTNNENAEEVFQPSVYDTLLINNTSRRIDGLFETYLIIGSDERSNFHQVGALLKAEQT